MPSGCTDHLEAMCAIGRECRRVVRSDERKQLFVSLTAGGLERTRKERPGDTLTPLREVDVSSDCPDVIKGFGVRAERLENLESDDATIGRPGGDFPDATGREPDYVIVLGLESERDVEHREHARGDDRVENSDHGGCIGGGDVANDEVHLGGT